MQSKWVVTHALAMALAILAGAACIHAQEPAPVSAAPTSEMMPLVMTRSLILDITEAASRAVAVGERGEVLVSESRTEWRQVPDVPTRSTLTAVSAVGDAVWAVGHDGTIIASRDGGLTWTLQRRDVFNPSTDAPFDPRQGVPLLDILMLSPTHGFAIGAYSQLLRTDDGGDTWAFVPTKPAGAAVDASEDDEADVDPDNGADNIGDEDNWTFSEDDLAMDAIAEPHFNAITRTGNGALIIVGERGTTFRSRDDGKSWERLQLPYGGSMFGVIAYGDDHVVAYGMRGNVYESHDLGDSWEGIDTGTELSLMGGAAYGDGGFVLVGANGIVLLRADGDSSPRMQVYSNASQETPVLAGVLVRPNRSLVVTGEKGVDGFTPGSK